MVILQGLGIVSYVVSTFSRKPIFDYQGMVGAMIIIILSNSELDKILHDTYRLFTLYDVSQCFICCIYRLLLLVW
ncbi:cytochrome c oxidase polypeptide I [Rickettsia typhi str. B9991CWPP]|nr:cytochrome c oxidase polypeptide I [Rickettsia typhi str. B9991CWPP]